MFWATLALTWSFLWNFSFVKRATSMGEIHELTGRRDGSEVHMVLTFWLTFLLPPTFSSENIWNFNKKSRSAKQIWKNLDEIRFPRTGTLAYSSRVNSLCILYCHLHRVSFIRELRSSFTNHRLNIISYIYIRQRVLQTHEKQQSNLIWI